MDETISKVKKICVECGTDTTYCYPKRNSMYEHWFSAKPFGKEGWICEKCKRRLRRRMGLDKNGNNRHISELTESEREKRRKYMREYARERRAMSMQKNRQYNKERNMKAKIRLMQILDQNCCVYCDYSIFPALQIDHKDSFGRKELLRFGSSITMKQYYIKHPEEARQRLQVVCANCNWLKRFRKGEDATLSLIPMSIPELTNSGSIV